MLEVPGTNFVIDGACENSPFECGPHSPAIYANHSRLPNARIESWPVPRPGPFEVRQHMVLVASEHIDAGQEIRINYEGGEEASYWEAIGHTPIESQAWREVRIHPPTPPLHSSGAHTESCVHRVHVQATAATPNRNIKGIFCGSKNSKVFSFSFLFSTVTTMRNKASASIQRKSIIR